MNLSPTTFQVFGFKTKIQSQFCDKIRKFSRKIAALHCVVSGLAKRYEPPILVCKETAENGE